MTLAEARAFQTQRDPLLEHIGDVQAKATRLAGVLSAIGYLDNESACRDGVTALVDIGTALARDISDDLDSVNLPRGGAS